MAGLVIHGGAGSVHFALRSGVPVLVTPFLFDQFVWGKRISEIGAGPAPLPFRRLTVQRLVDALQRLVSDAPLARSAARIGLLLQKEAGIAEAVRVIEAI
jgi:UDP:flavonoid glycosyltransferase YjiC (YdhE family)